MYKLKNVEFTEKPIVDGDNYVQSVNVVVGTEDGKLEQKFPLQAVIPFNTHIETVGQIRDLVWNKAEEWFATWLNS